MLQAQLWKSDTDNPICKNNFPSIAFRRALSLPMSYDPQFTNVGEYNAISTVRDWLSQLITITYENSHVTPWQLKNQDDIFS